MSVLKILSFPDHFLRKPTEPIKNIDGHLQTLIDDMAETMYAAPGVGLAAIQVGIGQSMLVYDLAPQSEDRQIQVLINPRIVHQEGSQTSEGEGCLSVPEYRSDVKRAASIIVEGYDQNEKAVTIEAHDFHAIVLQHEIDHLNGVLFIDHISALKRKLYIKRIQKMLKQKSI